MTELDASDLPVGASVPALGLSNKAVYDADVAGDGLGPAAGDQSANKGGFGDRDDGTVFKHVALKSELQKNLSSCFQKRSSCS
jgi:hypothetical protein